MTEFVPQGDPVIAAMFAGTLPQESSIIRTDWLATANNRKTLGKRKRIVDLSCNHKAITANQYRHRCERCAMMMKHGFDMELWLRDPWGPYDGMSWPEDPLRGFHERLD